MKYIKKISFALHFFFILPTVCHNIDWTGVYLHTIHRSALYRFIVQLLCVPVLGVSCGNVLINKHFSAQLTVGWWVLALHIYILCHRYVCAYHAMKCVIWWHKTFTTASFDFVISALLFLLFRVCICLIRSFYASCAFLPNHYIICIMQLWMNNNLLTYFVHLCVIVLFSLLHPLHLLIPPLHLFVWLWYICNV